MPLVSIRCFNIGLVLSLLVLLACVATGIWAIDFDFLEDEGLRFNNGQELLAYRDGLDFRIGVFQAPIFGIGLTPSDRLRHFDGLHASPLPWPKLPKFNMSLWPVTGISMVLPMWWFVRRRLKEARGFPVESNHLEQEKI